MANMMDQMLTTQIAELVARRHEILREEERVTNTASQNLLMSMFETNSELLTNGRHFLAKVYEAAVDGVDCEELEAMFFRGVEGTVNLQPYELVNKFAEAYPEIENDDKFCEKILYNIDLSV